MKKAMTTVFVLVAVATLGFKVFASDEDGVHATVKFNDGKEVKAVIKNIEGSFTQIQDNKSLGYIDITKFKEIKKTDRVTAVPPDGCESYVIEITSRTGKKIDVYGSGGSGSNEAWVKMGMDFGDETHYMEFVKSYKGLPSEPCMQAEHRKEPVIVQINFQ